MYQLFKGSAPDAPYNACACIEINILPIPSLKHICAEFGYMHVFNSFLLILCLSILFSSFMFDRNEQYNGDNEPNVNLSEIKQKSDESLSKFMPHTITDPILNL